MQQPPGFIDAAHPNYVSKLHKSIYGLKQALRAWYEKLMNILLSFNFKLSSADSSLFVQNIGSRITIILIYVDDILLTGNSSTYCKDLISQLRKHFPLKDLGESHYFLGLQAKRNANGIFLSQTKYALDLLDIFDMGGAKSCSSPVPANCKLVAQSCTPLSDPTYYRSLVGAL